MTISGFVLFGADRGGGSDQESWGHSTLIGSANNTRASDRVEEEAGRQRGPLKVPFSVLFKAQGPWSPGQKVVHQLRNRYPPTLMFIRPCFFGY